MCRVTTLVVLLVPIMLATEPLTAQNSPPDVENVTAEQVQYLTRLVEIDYDLSDTDGDICRVYVEASGNGGATWTVPVNTINGDVGEGIVPGAGKQIVWNPWMDMLGQSGSQYAIRVCADDGQTPPGMALVTECEYAMGCHVRTGENCISNELPVHDVYIDAFYMDIYEVTNQQYADALNWALGQGGLIQVIGGVVYKAGDSEPYCDTTTSSTSSRINWYGSSFGVVGGKEDHPMVMVSWYGAAAYSNWRSGMEGRTPSYDTGTWDCNFSADGYRLPTEAEWEKAARGGEHDPYYTYPWGNAIDDSQANFYISGDPYETGNFPWTTPVGYYDGGQTPPGVDMANGYGLYDMAGNVHEWCHDWYNSSYYSSSPTINPQGPPTGTRRILRGGSWAYVEEVLRCASRNNRNHPDFGNVYSGFRLALDASSVSSRDIGCGSTELLEITTEVVSSDFTCTPPSGTVPFVTSMTAQMNNLYPGQNRRIAGHIDVQLPNTGPLYTNWRSGYTNVPAGDSYISAWNQTIPALGSLIGDNLFTLVAEDVTPSPYNQPPYPASGDTDTASCTVTGIAP